MQPLNYNLWGLTNKKEFSVKELQAFYVEPRFSGVQKEFG